MSFLKSTITSTIWVDMTQEPKAVRVSPLYVPFGVSVIIWNFVPVFEGPLPPFRTLPPTGITVRTIGKEEEVSVDELQGLSPTQWMAVVDNRTRETVSLHYDITLGEDFILIHDPTIILTTDPVYVPP